MQIRYWNNRHKSRFIGELKTSGEQYQMQTGFPACVAGITLTMERNKPKQNINEFKKVGFETELKDGSKQQANVPMIEVFSRKEINRLDALRHLTQKGGKR